MITIIDFLKTFALFVCLDVIYLGFIRKNTMDTYFEKFGGYHKHIIIYGLVTWALLALGTQYFVISKSTDKYSAFLNGALLGLIIYGVYDFTNMATIKGWTHSFLLQDIAWGTVLCGFIAYIRK
jgi:uncharacterized membrane protein